MTNIVNNFIEFSKKCGTNPLDGDRNLVKAKKHACGSFYVAQTWSELDGVLLRTDLNCAAKRFVFSLEEVEKRTRK